jgi:hypothetical protein
MHHAVCVIVCGHTAPTTSGSPVNPSQTTMSTSFTPRFLISVSTCSQYSVAGDRERKVVGPVGDDLPIADLQVDRIDEDHRIDRSEVSRTAASARLLVWAWTRRSTGRTGPGWSRG